MSKIIAIIKNGVITGVYSDDPNIETEILDYDGYKDTESLEEQKYIERLENEIKTMIAIW